MRRAELQQRQRQEGCLSAWRPEKDSLVLLRAVLLPASKRRRPQMPVLLALSMRL